MKKKSKIRMSNSPVFSGAVVETNTGKIIDCNLSSDSETIKMKEPINEFKDFIQLMGDSDYATLCAENFKREDEFEIFKEDDTIIPNYGPGILWARIENYFNESTFILFDTEINVYAIKLHLISGKDNLIARSQ